MNNVRTENIIYANFNFTVLAVITLPFRCYFVKQLVADPPPPRQPHVLRRFEEDHCTGRV